MFVMILLELVRGEGGGVVVGKILKALLMLKI